MKHGSFIVRRLVASLASAVALVVACWVCVAEAGEANPIARAAEQVRAEFERLDADHNRQLSRSEFLQREGDRRVLQRDFRLYDLDESQRLSRSEFASVAGLTEPRWRGRIPDPQDQLAAEAIAALDQSYDNWRQRPGEQVNAHAFVAKFLASISDGGKLFVTGRMIVQADRNSDGRISRSEAQSFLRQQLGIGWHDGPPLRQPSGRLLRFDRFVDVDRDRNNQLSRGEFRTHWWNRATAEDDFLANDLNRDGQVTFAEFADHRSPNYFDPIEWFRRADTDLNALLDPGELLAASPAARQHLAASTFSGFDDNRDGQLSLQEYRCSMHANVNYSWHRLPVDDDRDGRLSYGEFIFNRVDLFQLQRRYFFHRLDRDGDNQLSSDEFDFRKLAPNAIRLRSTAGSTSRLLYQDQQYPRCDFPSVSPAGLRILFERRSNQDGSGRVAVIGIDGGGLRDLCDGSHPSWAADGNRFACARRDDREQIWIMSGDGWSGQPIADGTAPAWSPDGGSIAYLHDNGLWIYDVLRGETGEIYGRPNHPYQDLGVDIAWSADGRRLALLGTRQEASELVILEPAKSGDDGWQPRVRHRFPSGCRGDLDWSKEQGIVVGFREAKRPRSQLFHINPDDQNQPRRIKRFERGVDWKSACVAADGKWYIAVSE